MKYLSNSLQSFDDYQVPFKDGVHICSILKFIGL